MRNILTGRSPCSNFALYNTLPVIRRNGSFVSLHASREPKPEASYRSGGIATTLPTSTRASAERGQRSNEPPVASANGSFASTCCSVVITIRCRSARGTLHGDRPVVALPKTADHGVDVVTWAEFGNAGASRRERPAVEASHNDAKFRHAEILSVAVHGSALLAA